MVPGPTPLPPSVVAAGSRPIIYARSGEFVEMWQDMAARLARVFQTEGEVLVYAASGTGAAGRDARGNPAEVQTDDVTVER